MSGSRLGNAAALNALIDRSAPISKAAAVVPSDSTDLASPAINGLWIGVTGDVKVDLVTGGTAIVFKSVPVGFFNVAAKRVYATGTTATFILALT